MDYLIILLFLIISCVIGIGIALFMNITSYLIIALICCIIFICMELYYNYVSLPNQAKENNTNNTINTTNTLLANTGTGLDNKTNTTNIASIPSKTQSKLNVNAMTIKEFDMDKPPFDGLEPSELMSRLNYIYYATANPAKMVNYHDYQTHADTYLNKDGTKLSTDGKLQTYSAYYPQLTANQIDARDCLNEGSGINSCFQSPQLFFNAQNNFNILSKGVNSNNANLIIREDFAMPLNPNNRNNNNNNNILFQNAPRGNLDKPLDQQSNEYINLTAETNSQCRNCKLAICNNDVCSLQNSLFM